MYNYFEQLEEAKIKEPVYKARFIFLDNKGETDTPQLNPVGISYFTQISTCYTCPQNSGYAQYYSMGAACPVPLELGSSAVVGTRLTYD